MTDAWHADVDSLTGLPNRRGYSRRFPAIAAADGGLISGVAILDVDNFKAYSDLYGHAAGDTVLQQIGKLLLAYLRSDDVAFRIGGEEFVIACRSRTESGALTFFEAIRADIVGHQIVHRGNQPSDVVTASMGVAVFRGSQEPGRLFNSVDRALYVSKASGRNRITIAELYPMPLGDSDDLGHELRVASGP